MNHVATFENGARVLAVDFDYPRDVEQPRRESAEEIVVRIIDTLAKPPWKPGIFERRLIMLARVLRHEETCLCSLDEWGKRLGCSKAELSRIALKISRDFNVIAPWQRPNGTRKAQKQRGLGVKKREVRNKAV